MLKPIEFVWKKIHYTVDPKVFTDPNTIILLPNGTHLAFNGWKPGDEGLPEPVSAKIVTVVEASEKCDAHTG